jgi:NAD(P)-dependent dehydrogenase (short-subunit alcohol dehydrogenase family)
MKKFNKFQLNNKVAIITGSCGLLGKEHAYALLEAGCKVIITDLSVKALNTVKKELETTFKSENILCMKMDVTNKKDIQKVKNNLEEKDMSINILINNAAINPKVSKDNKSKELSRFENITLNDWDSQISVGLSGAFLCSQVFGQMMLSNKKGGVILNIASDLSVISPDQRIYRKPNTLEENQPVKPVTYSVIKTGLIGLTRYLSTYWADKNIRVNALSPGGVYTDQDSNFVEQLSSLIPLGRMAKKDEYRSAIQFLCSDASSYMNGQNIVIDGGRSIL